MDAYHRALSFTVPDAMLPLSVYCVCPKDMLCALPHFCRLAAHDFPGILNGMAFGVFIHRTDSI
jgi:hypothetical protein